MKCKKCGMILPDDSDFCQYCGRKIEKSLIVEKSHRDLNKHSNLHDSEENNDLSEKYYFENSEEFIVYCKYNKGKNVVWVSGEEYWNIYKQGYNLIEDGKIQEAIETLKSCFILNPIAISARFEICEAYLLLNNISAAKNTLLEMKDYLIVDSHIAHFYRRLGYIEAEERRYNVAAACFIYSEKYEKSPVVDQELSYIKQVSGIARFSDDPESLINKAKLPVIDKTKVAEENITEDEKEDDIECSYNNTDKAKEKSHKNVILTASLIVFVFLFLASTAFSIYYISLYNKIYNSMLVAENNADKSKKQYNELLMKYKILLENKTDPNMNYDNQKQMYSELQTTYDKLKKEYDEMKKEYERQSEYVMSYEDLYKLYLLDRYVVFVWYTDNAVYYHHYDCPKGPIKNGETFLAYNIENASYLGYVECQECKELFENKPDIKMALTEILERKK